MNRVVAYIKQGLLKQYFLSLLLSFLALPISAMMQPEPGQAPHIDLRVTRANFLIKELYNYKVGDYKVGNEFLMEQSDHRNFRRILQEQPYPQSPILHTILAALFNGEFESAHQAIQEAYGESVDEPDLSDFTLQDLKDTWAQKAIRAAVSHADFDFLEQESIPEISHESLTVHRRETRRRSREEQERAVQEQQEYQTALSESEQENKARQEELARRQEQEEQEFSQALVLSQEQENARIRAAQEAELEAKQRAEQEAKLKAKIKKEEKIKKEKMRPELTKEKSKQTQKQRLFAQVLAVKQEIADLQAAQTSIMGQLRRLPVSTGPQVDKLNDEFASKQEQIEPLEVKLFEIQQDMQKLEYPDNVIQYRLVFQKNNDCGFRSARHAVLGYLHAIGKINEKDFVNAIEVDEDAILSINDLKGLVNPDGTLMFPRPPDPLNPGKTLNDYATNELQLEKIMAVACAWPKLGTDAINTSNVSILPLILGLRNPETQFLYGFTDAIRAIIKQIRANPDFVHAFILNADQSALYEPRVTHWLPVIVEKQNGAYTYTILDSLNKGRLELIQDLIYLIEEMPQPE